MHQTASLRLARSLFVRISGGAYQHVFELDSAEERAFLVGSSRAADLCIERPGVAAVEFHVERLAGDVWLVPGYRGGGVLVNGAPLLVRRRLDERLVVELGTLSLEVCVSEDDVAPGFSRSSSAPRRLPSDYASLLPTDTARTAFAMTPFHATEGGDIGATLQTQPLAVVRSPAVLTEQRTERLARVVGPPLVEAPTLHQTQRLAPVVASQSRATPTIVVGAVEPVPALSPLADGVTALVVQDTTAFDVEACPPVAPPPQGAEIPAAQRGARVDLPARRLTGGPLERLGLLARARPGLVLGGGLATALLLSLALVGAVQLTARRGARPATHLPRPPVTMTSNAAPPAAQVESPRPRIVVVQAPSNASKRAPRGAFADPELAAAVGHLAAGRLSEAAQSYQALSERAEGAEVYGKLSAVLARRAGLPCAANSPGSNDTCPEIVK